MKGLQPELVAEMKIKQFQEDLSRKCGLFIGEMSSLDAYQIARIMIREGWVKNVSKA